MAIDAQLIRDEFPLDDELIFLNHAAVAPWPARSSLAVQQFATENSTRGPTDYLAWEARETTLRQQLARIINARSADEIALAKNTSARLDKA